ncbi:MAG: tetraacyldisaccharide 4'-kinase [Pirellulaceae bacterium]|nr:MAG: tetraacyldisaccharide 4'-kinase [Pirellulaceae bacterium]
MWNRAVIDRLLAGECGAGGRLLRAVLWCAARFYTAAVCARNAYYDYFPGAARKVPVPVISVGNLTVGGTGKTPVTAWLAKDLQQRGRRVAIVSRGYRRLHPDHNDEACVLRRHLPDTPLVQDPDRIRGALKAIEQFQADLIVLDDGFQHRRIARDLDILLLDALCPFGHGDLLPRGLLREPIGSLRRADLVVLTRADLVSPASRDAVWSAVERWLPGVPRIEVAFLPTTLANDRQVQALEGVRRIAAFCAIGNPHNFLETLRACRYEVVAFRAFADHHRFSQRDLRQLDQWARRQPGIDAVLCTEKDLVKCPLTTLGDRPLFAVRIEPQIMAGEQHWRAALEAFHRCEQIAEFA